MGTMLTHGNSIFVPKDSPRRRGAGWHHRIAVPPCLVGLLPVLSPRNPSEFPLRRVPTVQHLSWLPSGNVARLDIGSLGLAVDYEPKHR